MITSPQATPNVLREDDLQQHIVSTLTPDTEVQCSTDSLLHIEDTPLFWVYRNGRMQRLSWSDMTEQEREYTQEAERHDYFDSLFDPNYC